MASNITRLRNIKAALTLRPGTTEKKSIGCVVGGRVKSCRIKKGLNFVDLIDGSTNSHLQVVIKKDLIKKIDTGAYLAIQGQLIESKWPQQDVEFKADEVVFYGRCDHENYPLTANDSVTNDNWYRNYFHLRPRVSHFTSLLRIRSEIEFGLHMILKQMDFFKVNTPILTSNDTESSGDLFKVTRIEQTKQSVIQNTDSSSDSESDIENNSKDGSFFGKDVFLTTSAQLHLESLAASLSRVYSLSPIFRAENSLGARHLCEFTMLEAEEANVFDIDPLMDRVETIVKFSAQYLSDVSERKGDLLKLLDRYQHHEAFEKMASSKYIRMTHSEAIEILQKCVKDPSHAVSLSRDINKTHERYLLKHCDNVPIFITNYPKQLKPYYMKASSENTVACFDLIAPLGGEICGGSLREDDLDKLKHNLSGPAKDMDWYLQLREFGSFPHGGFGIGLERLIKSLTGIVNIKDTIAYPRSPGRCPM